MEATYKLEKVIVEVERIVPLYPINNLTIYNLLQWIINDAQILLRWLGIYYVSLSLVRSTEKS